MAGDELVGLRIDLDTDGAQAEVKELGTTTKKTAKSMEKDLQKVEKQSDKNRKSLTDAGQAGGKAASILGAGFSSVSAGLGAMTASAESFETSMVGVGASIAAGFGAGGPVGGALALASAAVGTLIGEFKRAEEDAKRAAEAQAKFLEDVAAATEASAGSIESIRDSIRARLIGSTALQFLQAEQKIRDEIRENEFEMLDLERQGRRLVADAAAEILKTNVSRETAAELAREVVAEELKALGIQRDALSLANDERENQLVLLESYRTEVERIDDAEKSVAKSRKDGAQDYSKFYLGAEESAGNLLDLTSDLVTVDQEHLTWLQQQNRERERAEDLERRKQELAERNTRTVREQNELLRASNRFERDRIRARQEFNRQLERNVSQAEALENLQLKLADIAEREAEEAKRIADQAERAASASEKRAQSSERSARAAKDESRARSVPFGASRNRVGTGLGNILAPVRVLPARIAGRSAASELPPKVDKSTEATKETAETLEKTNTAQTKQTQATKDLAAVAGSGFATLVAEVERLTNEANAAIADIKQAEKKAQQLGIGTG